MFPDALIAFMTATAEAQAEATKAAQRAGIEHAMENGAKNTGERTYLGRKPTYSRSQLAKVQELLGRQTIGIAAIATDTGLSRQTVYRIKEDPAAAEAALSAWEIAKGGPRASVRGVLGAGH
jgi:putative DNA-invertase from lambdoid prophage Rac